MNPSRPNPLRSIRVAIIALSAATLTLGSGFAQEVSLDFTAPADSASSSDSAPETSYESLRANAEQFQVPFNHIKNVIDVVQPSVVHLEAVKTSSSNGVDRTIEEAGAGILLDLGGIQYVLTNRHVVDQADPKNILVQLSDGTFFHPVRVLTDAGTDLAVLETTETNLPYCHIRTNQEAEIGEFVIAIGSPFGLNHSASYGIVSATGRRDLQLGNNGVRYQDFIQTDAAINPGNSGGPLIDLSGQVIGINTAIASNSGSNEGIGFAIPIDLAIKVASDLIDKGQVERAFLGVSLDAHYSPEIASQLGLRTIYGARIAAITDDSPAADADLNPGDVILKFDGRVVENDSHLVHVVSMTPIGTSVSIEIYRDGRRQRVTATVQDRKAFDPR